MRAKSLRKLLMFQLIATSCMGVISCNEKVKEETEIAILPSNVAVSKFYIQANNKVMSNLDSVFFSIDLDHGVIFNADSLPKGTDVSKLVPSITFSNTMTRADLIFFKENRVDTTVNYLENATDTIDFTYPVKLEVTALNEETKFSYTIKVNVHQQDPDTLIWSKLEFSDLPSRYPLPVAQKSLKKDDKIYSLIEEYDGTYTLAYTSKLNEGEWIKNKLDIDNDLQIESFTAGSEYFYILTDNQELNISPDAITWEQTGENWVKILGSYNSGVLGIKLSDEILKFAVYPFDSAIVESAVPADFPIYGSTDLCTVETNWSETPVVILAGGVTAESKYSSAVWAFDGSTWAIINNNYLPAVKSPMLARYIVYRDSPSLFQQRAFDAWFFIGGIDADNEFNNSLYISLDNGVTWSLAPEQMQFSDGFPNLYSANLLIDYTSLSSDLSDAWTIDNETKTRVSFTIEDTTVIWQCPYLYIFGGYNEDNILSDTIWRGVLNRLRFTPNV